MKHIVQNITNNISFTLANINVLKNTFLDQNLIDKYNRCNELRVKFTEFYQEIFKQISILNHILEPNIDSIINSINTKYIQIKSVLNFVNQIDNKILIKDIEDIILQTKKLFDFLIEEQIKNPISTEEMPIIQNHLTYFKHDLIY
jgi:hypothetical protein